MVVTVECKLKRKRKSDLAIPLGMNLRGKRFSVSLAWKKADPSSLIPLWWEQNLTTFWTPTLTRDRRADFNLAMLHPPACSCGHYTFFYLFFYTNNVIITNVWTVINKQEMAHNKNQMETNVISASVLYFLGIRHSLVSDHYGTIMVSFKFKMCCITFHNF